MNRHTSTYFNVLVVVSSITVAGALRRAESEKYLFWDNSGDFCSFLYLPRTPWLTGPIIWLASNVVSHNYYHLPPGNDDEMTRR